MGFIQQSNDIKIYAYLTQLGKNKILTATNVDDFQITHFSLHDDDINYKIASVKSGLTYTIPQSGFIPNITGDDDNCSPNISKSIILKNKILGYIEPQPPDPDPNPEPQPLGAKVIAYCELNNPNLTPQSIPINPDDISSIEKTFYKYNHNVDNSFSIAIESPSGGTNNGYKWYVVREIISFPNSDSTTPIVLASAQSQTFINNEVGNTPQSFKATFYEDGSYNDDISKFPTNQNGNGLIEKWIFSQENGYKQRIADAFNFLVYLEDSSGTKKLIRKFENINCSKRILLAKVYKPYLSNYTKRYRNFPNLFNFNSQILQSGSFTNILFTVLDLGNSRKELNLDVNDLEFFTTEQEQFNFGFGSIPLLLGDDNGITTVQLAENGDNGWGNFSFNVDNLSTNQQVIFKTPISFVKSEIIETAQTPSSIFINEIEGGFDVLHQLAPPEFFNITTPLQSSPPALTNIRFDPLHPKVELFNNWKPINNKNAFDIQVVQISHEDIIVEGFLNIGLTSGGQALDIFNSYGFIYTDIGGIIDFYENEYIISQLVSASD